ncbi:MAG TPA: hypothetical protein VH134_14610 [Candidatus Dormibacteraeota bacterium]|nr:hypothetical protein [Candidatus Dormibacteraeota bacterium]
MAIRRRQLGAAAAVALFGGAAMIAVPRTASAAVRPSAVTPAERDRDHHKDGDHRGTHRGDDPGSASNENSSSSSSSSSSSNSNNSSSGASGSSLITLDNVANNVLNGLSIHVLGG